MVDGSLESNDQSDPPGVQFAWGGWNLRPHPSRLTRVDTAVLQQWAKIFDAPGTPADEARLLRPITREHVEILGVVAQQHVRIADLGYEWSSLWHEKGAKKDGYIEWRTEVPAEWAEVILQGPHFSVANSNTMSLEQEDYVLLFATEKCGPCRITSAHSAGTSVRHSIYPSFLAPFSCHRLDHS